ncbi:MAG: HEAT repeat domain-containing protein [Waddliaceae bacterium]
MRPRTLYQMQKGKPDLAMEGYLAINQDQLFHDSEFLQEMALMLFHHGISRDQKEYVRLLTLIGAGFSMDERTLPILEQGLQSKLPLLQLVALHQIVRLDCKQTDQLIEKRLGTCHPLVRLEGALILSRKKSPLAFSVVEGLRHQLPPKLCVVMPQMYALMGDAKSKKVLHQLLQHPQETVRAESIIQVAKHGHDDLLPHLRKLSYNHGPFLQEALAYALGELKDEQSIPALRHLSHSAQPEVRLSALTSLHKLGNDDAKNPIIQAARKGDLFAISALGDVPGSEETLMQLTTENPDHQIRINAALSLLKRKDQRVAPYIYVLLEMDSQFRCLRPIRSGAGTLHAWKTVVTNPEDADKTKEISLRLREEILHLSFLFPEPLFLTIAENILVSGQGDLLPETTKLLASLQTDDAILLLNKYRHKIGDPLVRNWCTLALYNIQTENSYEGVLKEWVLQESQVPLMNLRALIPQYEQSSMDRDDTISLTEASQLYVAILEAFLQKQEECALETLIEVIRNGNPLNRFVLAGLLLRAAQ